jgi:hypothetical protein
MPDPVIFESMSARFSLPFLFVGQSQKEDFVNEALSMLDGLVHCAIEDERNTPPTAPVDGQSWMIGLSPTGEWAGQDGKIAMRQLGQWLFANARDGMQILNKATGQRISRAGGAWHAPAVPAAPTGGTVIDTEARSALAALVSALRAAGVLPA